MRKKQNVLKVMIGLIAIIFLTSCAATKRSLVTTRARIGYTTAIHNDLVSLPTPERKIVVAVYKFRDQTGQYKYHPQATSFSTAVTQGATSMLIKALEDSGWFIPIEREGLPNLLTERKIIRSTRENYKHFHKEQKKDVPTLPPLMYASIIMEGGIIAYESNTVTGGFGTRYFGVGGSVETRRDQVTIYLRAIGVKNGRILKSVSTTKSILSRGVDFGIFRFVRLKRLLEVETGLTVNEPPQLCVMEAVEKAVFDLIVEGSLNKNWNLRNPEDIRAVVIQDYLKEREESDKRVVFDKEGNLVKIIEKEG